MRVRWLAATMFVGPIVVALWLLLPHGEIASLPGVIGMACSAVALGIGLTIVPADAIPDLVLKLCLFAVTAVISVGIVFSGESGIWISFFYMWAVPYSFAYFTARDGLYHTAWVAVCYAAALAYQHQQGVANVHHPVGQWLIVIASLVVVGTLVRELTRWARASDERFRRGFDDSRVPMLLAGLDGRALEINDAMCALLGQSRDGLIGSRLGTHIHPDDFEPGRVLLLRILDGLTSNETIEVRLLHGDGSDILVAATVSAVRDGRDLPACFFLQLQDVTDARRNVAELQRRGRQQQAIARLGQLALTEPDLGAFMTHLAATLAETLGVERTSILEFDPEADEFLATAGIGWPAGTIGTLRTSARERTPAGLALATKSAIVVDDVRGDERFAIPEVVLSLGVRSGVATIVDGHDAPFGVLVVYSSVLRSFGDDDVAFVQAAANVLSSAVDRRRADDANRFAALHDPLTGLANRTLALDRLQHALARRRRDDSLVAVFVLDLDRFKVINDSLGHDVGDGLLLQLAPRLADAVRPADTVARLGGDEFVVVCENVDSARHATQIAQRVSEAIARPLALQSGEHFLTASIGLAISSAPTDTPETLVRDADAAMYRAKESGRGRIELFDDRMRKRVLERLEVESDLRRAIAHDELRVFYQPVVDTFTGRPLAVEALVRWQHPRRGLLGPAEFIPVAEESGLIALVGRWVLRTATTQVAAWQQRFGPLELCVNVSGREIANPLFPDEVAAVVDASGMLPGTLGLEITETVLIEEAGSPVEVLAALHDRGLRLVLDDFGTGYSSLSYLKNFPLDGLKLDRTFVEGLGVLDGDAAIVEAIIVMAKAVRMDVVAEGVETEAHLATLRRLGCARAQGYLFARPMAAGELELYLAEHRDVAVA